jgi:protein phosphatase
MRATPSLEVDLDDSDQVAAAIAWWAELTQSGGEGMVVKPRDVIATTKRGISQPGIKCRGAEYLRIMYGAEYTAPEYLDRLRQRGLGHKRSLAVREYVLGIEALERFVAREPLYRVHECVFGVLALESEPVRPSSVTTFAGTSCAKSAHRWTSNGSRRRQRVQRVIHASARSGFGS